MRLGVTLRSRMRGKHASLGPNKSFWSQKIANGMQHVVLDVSEALQLK